VVLPEKDPTYKVIAFGSSEKDANQSAVAKATEVLYAVRENHGSACLSGGWKGAGEGSFGGVSDEKRS
jgi:hypothetical protein